MYRKILFKGKRTDNGEWMKGYVERFSNGKWQIARECDNPPDCDPMWSEVLITHEVDPDTICRCTWLPDKKGRKIWENDILRYKDYIGVVKYGKHREDYGFYIEWKNDCLTRENIIFWSDKVNVIGNIFDDPGILKKLL